MSAKQPLPPPEHVDVLIIGAGISGIGAAYYLGKEQPAKTYAILEARGNLGGTWDLFRYPGIRSDSDLHTFGYAFKPWKHEKAIASADLILDYLHETARENGIDGKIRYHHQVISADWSSEAAQWRVEVARADSGERLVMTCHWLFCAAGYYRYDEGFCPTFEGRDRFQGQIVHPQHWPENLDYRGKRVVVIGSGATAVTLIPSMAHEAAHVTMLQRTPTYIMNVPSKDPVANLLRKVLPDQLAYDITRRKNIVLQRAVFNLCQRYPKPAKRLIRFLNARQLPKDFPIDQHLNPPYNPWDQRLCAVPDGDLFKAFSKGRASIVTDRIKTFTERGILLASGQELEADIIVTATGLNVRTFGGMQLNVDGAAVDVSERLAFKGMMLSGIPNFAFAIGYTNASWTLKVGLLCEHFCRLLGYMDQKDYAICYPKHDPHMPTRPLLDFGAGYIQRVMNELPRQGSGYPWVMSMDYDADVKSLRKGPVEDPNLCFASRSRATNLSRKKSRAAV